MLATLRKRLDSWWLILIFGALYVASQATIAVIVHPLGADFLAVQTTLSVDHVREIFERWQTAGLLGTYAAHYRFDMIHPLWYSTLLAALVAKGLEATRAPAARSLLLCVPFAAGACDVIENLVHRSFLADRANITQAAVWLGNGAALTKWSLVVFCLALIGLLALHSRRTAHAQA